MENIIVILISVVSGVIAGLGQGGGSILILLLALIQKMPQQLAQGTNLVFFVPTAIIATIMNFKQKCINLKIRIDYWNFRNIRSNVGS